MTINKAVAMRVSKLLIKNNMTPYRLAVNSGIQHSTLQNILEEKYTDVKMSTIYKLARGFNMTIIEFINDDLFKETNLDIE